MSLSSGKPPRSGSREAMLDSELVALAQAGETFAFEQLITRYYSQISFYLVRMVGNDAIGVELTQETFLKAWQALPSLQDEAHFVGWLKWSFSSAFQSPGCLNPVCRRRPRIDYT